MDKKSLTRYDKDNEVQLDSRNWFSRPSIGILQLRISRFDNRISSIYLPRVLYLHRPGRIEDQHSQWEIVSACT